MHLASSSSVHLQPNPLNAHRQQTCNDVRCISKILSSHCRAKPSQPADRLRRQRHGAQFSISTCSLSNLKRTAHQDTVASSNRPSTRDLKIAPGKADNVICEDGVQEGVAAHGGDNGDEGAAATFMPVTTDKLDRRRGFVYEEHQLKE